METARFAPSPTGWLHLGHAYAAWFASERARGGRFLLRIEDIEADRVRAEYERGIFEDLAWLGLTWEEPVVRQSERLPWYDDALHRLVESQAVYRCFCSRRQIAEEIAAAGGAPHGAPPVYPGTCRGMTGSESEARAGCGEPYAWRLDLRRACEGLGPMAWRDRRHGEQRVDPEIGDPVVARKDIATSYHVACVIDDAEQGVTLVTRGEDLLASTGIHRALQGLLGLPVPEYEHHPLVGDGEGNRLSKRDHSVTIRSLRAEGLSPDDVLNLARSRLLR